MFFRSHFGFQYERSRLEEDIWRCVRRNCPGSIQVAGQDFIIRAAHNHARLEQMEPETVGCALVGKLKPLFSVCVAQV